MQPRAIAASLGNVPMFNTTGVKRKVCIGRIKAARNIALPRASHLAWQNADTGYADDGSSVVGLHGALLLLRQG